MKNGLSRISLAAVVAMFVLQPIMSATTPLTVLTVPWEPTTPLSPHTTYPINATTEATIVLAATVPAGITAGDSVTVVWSFGDGSPNTTVVFSNIYDISTTHQYPASASLGTAWTATVTVTDTTQKTSGTAKYYVTQACGPASGAPCTPATALTSRVNVAIDTGLWYLHQTMWRNTTTVGVNTVNWGGWDTQTYACPTVGGNAYACMYYGVIDAENVQAFEVSGHLGTGPATDPYTDDVVRGSARMFNFLASQANVTNTYQYNPATVNYGCSDGSQVQTDGTCVAPATKVYYDAGATSCLSPPCTFTFDGNSPPDGQMIFSNDGSGETVYTGGPFMDALVASGNPTATAPTGPAGVLGLTYKNIVQNMVDWYAACQYGYDEDPSNEPGYNGYVRGAGYSASGGGWLYGCQQGDDNSTSQWAAIGFIGASRGFNLAIPQVVMDMNNVWVTNSQDVTQPRPAGSDPFYSIGDDYGAFGYRGSFAYSQAWGAYAVTPSGMVQMALDGIGRTNNTAFGNSSNDPDQRWNNTETFYADNFCNATVNGAYYSPRSYTYGMFSFTKSMLLHDPNGALSPIQFMRTETPSVFTGDPNDPSNTIDWYAALSPANGGTDLCDGVAQTLVAYQSPDGHWYGNDYDQGYQSNQSPFETAWSLIMLRKTVFVNCVKNLNGRGTPSGVGSAQITLGWTAQTNANGYAVLRGTANGGPYTQVGTTQSTVYNDRSGLKNGGTYYYVVQPLQGTTEICQSNQATITIPK